MTLGLRTKMLPLFGFLVVIVAGNFAIHLIANRNAAEQQSWVFHTHNVIGKSEAFLGHMRDAETGQRGFLLTNLPKYLEPYNTGIRNSHSDLTALKRLTRTTPYNNRA